MADIHVETKKHNNTIPAWIWIVIALAVVLLLAFLLTKNNTTTNQNKGVNNSNTTSYAQPAIQGDVNVMYHLG